VKKKIVKKKGETNFEADEDIAHEREIEDEAAMSLPWFYWWAIFL